MFEHAMTVPKLQVVWRPLHSFWASRLVVKVPDEPEGALPRTQGNAWDNVHTQLACSVLSFNKEAGVSFSEAPTIRMVRGYIGGTPILENFQIRRDHVTPTSTGRCPRRTTGPRPLRIQRPGIGSLEDGGGDRRPLPSARHGFFLLLPVACFATCCT